MEIRISDEQKDLDFVWNGDERTTEGIHSVDLPLLQVTQELFCNQVCSTVGRCTGQNKSAWDIFQHLTTINSTFTQSVIATRQIQLALLHKTRFTLNVEFENNISTHCSCRFIQHCKKTLTKHSGQEVKSDLNQSLTFNLVYEHPMNCTNRSVFVAGGGGSHCSFLKNKKLVLTLLLRLTSCSKTSTIHNFLYTCLMDSTMVKVLPVPGGPNTMQGAGLELPRTMLQMARACSGFGSGFRE